MDAYSANPGVHAANLAYEGAQAIAAGVGALATKASGVVATALSKAPESLPENLHSSAASGDMAGVELALGVPGSQRSEQYVNRLENGMTPLFLAAQSGHHHVIALLLSRSARTEIKCSNERCTALHIAALNGHLDAVRALITEENVNCLSGNGSTPLHFAARNGHIVVVSFLLTNGADTSIENNDGFKAVAIASQNQHRAVVEMLNEEDQAAAQALPVGIHEAARDGNLTDLQHALGEANSNQSLALRNHRDAEGLTPLFLAAQNGHTACVELLLAHGADVNASCGPEHRAPLHEAAARGHLRVCEALSQNCQILSGSGSNALHFAARGGHLPVVEYLISRSVSAAHQNNDGFTPAQVAFQQNHINVADKLERAAPGSGGVNMTIHDAVRLGNQMNLHMILGQERSEKSLARRNELSPTGFTPLHVAAEHGRLECLRDLLRHGASTTIRCGGEQLVPLHVAAQAGHIEVVRELLAQRGADVNILSGNGSTPLHLAARAGHLEVARALAAAGANLNAKNRDGMTPFQVACTNNRGDLAVGLRRNTTVLTEEVKNGLLYNLTDRPNDLPDQMSTAKKVGLFGAIGILAAIGGVLAGIVISESRDNRKK
ncbi:MAG: ankyrin repeat domain-containing protein [Verrucomicrobia bacterium]|nr:ankyrin repeat domain-containing protein [Verrucomicrobiota bacterium]